MSAREELIAHTAKQLWKSWSESAEEMGSQAAATLFGLGMLVPEGGAQELERLKARVAELETFARAAVGLPRYRDHFGDIWEERPGGELELVELFGANRRVAIGSRVRAEMVRRDWGPLDDLAPSGGVAALRARLAELESERHVTNEALSDAAEALRAGRDRIAELETERKAGWARYLSADERSSFLAELTVAASGMDETWAVDNVRTVLAVWRGAADEGKARGRRPLEDPHDSPLHHPYLVGRDLPEYPHA